MVNVEDQLRAVITRQADRYEVPSPDIDGFAAGAKRRQRRQRTVAALATCAVLGIVASGLVAGRSMWDTSGAGPADQPTSPTPAMTQNSYPDVRVGIVGPPPPGTAPSGPATGRLVAAATTYNTGSWVYADGRLINVMRNHLAARSDEFRGYVVRYLTPSGVEAIRSFMLDGTEPVSGPSEYFERLVVREGDRLTTLQPFAACGNAHMEEYGVPEVQARICPALEHPETWLPASAWEVPTYQPFIPATFQVCLNRAEDTAVLPARVADTFLASPSEPRPWPGADCRAVATGDATTIAVALADAIGLVPAAAGGYVSNEFSLESFGGDSLWFAPILPHGGTFCDCG